MQDTALYQYLLGLQSPWMVSRVNLDVKGQQVDKDPVYFRQVFVDHGAVAWPGDVDLAPDAMYAAIKAQGVWLLT